jgi:regulator of RNase E activity RraA
MSYPIVDPSVLAALKKFDTPTICNVLELFDIRPRTAEYGWPDPTVLSAAADGGLCLLATFRARTNHGQAMCMPAWANRSKRSRRCGPAVIVFQDLGDPVTSATFGEVMCTTYKAFGCAGLIASGTGRDLDQVEALNRASLTATICSHGYCQIVDIQIPVRVGGVTVYPGDLLHGDRSSISTIPNELTAAVADACPPFMDAEAVVLDYLKAGKPDVKGFNDRRNECQRLIGELAKKCRKAAGR